ncbi:hypothetical protein ABID37_002970 [Aquamicrobium terrae]|uniref:Uncharacterized protein n=1 Tax=Aquamicrobium terrae TaxID=1324945 RepID=A0ABV2N3P2_9HYPH
MHHRFPAPPSPRTVGKSLLAILLLHNNYIIICCVKADFAGRRQFPCGFTSRLQFCFAVRAVGYPKRCSGMKGMAGLGPNPPADGSMAFSTIRIAAAVILWLPPFPGHIMGCKCFALRPFHARQQFEQAIARIHESRETAGDKVRPGKVNRFEGRIGRQSGGCSPPTGLRERCHRSRQDSKMSMTGSVNAPLPSTLLRKATSLS